jgi:NAD(P)H-flavin reductase/ferredoxin
MPNIAFEGQNYQSRDGESILDCLIRHDVSVTYSCRSGICQSCMMVAVDGDPGADAQQGLREGLRRQDHFLICACVPETDMAVAVPENIDNQFDAEVLSLHPLSADVQRLRLAKPGNYSYLPGQFLNLSNAEGISRSYSLASVPEQDDFLELQVRVVEGGQVSAWVAGLAAGDVITISQANGECSYLPGHEDQPMLLLGTGTGLAPLLGIARDALRQGQRAPIHLYHGSAGIEGLYLIDELREMAKNNAIFHYHPCVSRGEAAEGLRSGRAADLALQDVASFSGWRVYLCGRADMVKAVQKKTFLAGAAMKDIFADPFVDSMAATNAVNASKVKTS